MTKMVPRDRGAASDPLPPQAGRVMICLVGEQPVPNLIPIRHFRPRAVILVHSRLTRSVSDGLKGLLDKEYELRLAEVDPYDVVKARRGLTRLIGDGGWAADELIFNFTGGTKPMAVAAFQSAQELGADVVYLQSEGGKSTLYRYGFKGGEAITLGKEEAAVTLSIGDYLSAHGLGNFRMGHTSNDFEGAVACALRPHVSEVVTSVRASALKSLEIDLIVRCGNQFGIAELKTGAEASKKYPIDQLNAATGREFLGTYTRRFLIIDRLLPRENRDLASAYRIEVIELCDRLASGSLSPEDGRRLVEAVTSALGQPPSA